MNFWVFAAEGLGSRNRGWLKKISSGGERLFRPLTRPRNDACGIHTLSLRGVRYWKNRDTILVLFWSMENSYTALCKTSFVSRFFLGITHPPRDFCIASLVNIRKRDTIIEVQGGRVCEIISQALPINQQRVI